MLSDSGLEKLLELTSPEDINNRVQEITESTVIATPQTLKLNDLEKYLPSKRRMQALMRTDSLDSFGLYCLEMGSRIDSEEFVPVFIESKDMTATAIFDFGDINNPLHGDNRSVLSCKETAAYRAFLDINGNQCRQRDFAEWVEDWKGHITMYDNSGSEMSFSSCLQAIRNYEVSHKTEAGSEVQQFSTKKTAMSSVTAKNADKLPSFIGFKCKPYSDLSENEFMMRVSVINNDAPTFVVRATHLEQDQENMAEEFSGLVELELNGQHSGKSGPVRSFSIFIGSV